MMDYLTQPGRLGTVRNAVYVSVLLIMFMTTTRAQPLAPNAMELGNEFGHIASQVSPTVVSITSVRIIEGQAMNPLQRFFEQQLPDGFNFNMPEREFRRRGLGSGVIVSDDGYVLTNNHVVANAEELTVTLHDERQFSAEIVGTDPPTDIALLRIKGGNLPVAELGNSDGIEIGSFVVAIGSPFGLAHTVTVGNISATGRANVGIAEYEDFIQTDAAINPGNSGGPLVDMNGKVVGINTAIFSRGGGSIGVGFAVPINMVKSVMNAIREEGHVTRGWLGISIQDVTPQLADALGTEYEYGALVADVMPQTPAAQSDLKRGDIIIALNGKRTDDTRELRQRVADTAPGTDVTLTVGRNGEAKKIQVKVGERPRQSTTQAKVQEKLGFSVHNLTDQLRQRLNIEEEEGVLVAKVVPGSAAAAKGIRPGMVIKEVNRKQIANVNEFRQEMQKAMDNDAVLLLVSFRGQTSYILVPLA